MLRPEHEALLQGALDGSLTPEEDNALRELLARDAAARERAGELGRLNALLASLGRVDAPPQLVAEVLAQVSTHPAAAQPARPLDFAVREPHREGHVGRRSIPKRGVTVNKNVIFGLAAAAVVIVAVMTYTNYPPATEGTEATIGAAQRAQAPQIAAKDVGLGDTSAQDILQTDTWDAIMKDDDLRASLQDVELRRMLEDAELRRALENDAVRRSLQDPEFARYLKRRLSDQALTDAEARSMKKLTQLEAALSNEAFARVLARRNFAEALLRADVRRAFSGEAMARALRDRNFDAAIRSNRFGEALARRSQQ
jgi:hypothetical protein